MHNLAIWFLIFLIYSFFGWVMEVINSLIVRRRFVNRGFLIGPICPIYGTGALAITFCLGSIQNPLVIFFTSIILSAILEYTTSVLMERLFHVRWWDYSDRPFNLNGRICLEALIIFGIGGTLVTLIFSPALYHILSNLPDAALYSLALVFVVALLADAFLSLYLIKGFRVTVGIAAKDATIEISERVHDLIMAKGKLSRRLLKAFPNQTPAPRRPRAKTRQK